MIRQRCRVAEGQRRAKPTLHLPKRYHSFVKLKIVLEPSDEGGFTVYVPSLPGCISEGETREEALVNIREAIELYLEPDESEMSAVPGAEVEELVV